jgi:small subunit ribosomal protein S3
MGNKVNPVGLRIGITSDWKSKWFSKKDYKQNLREDIEIRGAISKKWKNAAISDVEVERSAAMIRFIIRTARPGILIGRGGSGVADIQKYIKDKFLKNRKIDIKIEIQEIGSIEEDASIIAQNIAEQLEKRIPFKRAMKSMLDQVSKNSKIKGVKIEMSGRLGGAEMSRREWGAKGTLPLHTLRADVDFSRATAYTTYGTIGIKVWLYKGEKF